MSGQDHDVCNKPTEEEEHTDSKIEIETLKIEAFNKEHNCSSCEYKSFKKKYVTIHEKLNHGEYEASREILKCSQCEYECQANLRKQLRRHTEAVHGDIKNFSCSYCRYESYYKLAIENHIKSFHKNLDAQVLRMSRQDHDSCKISTEDEKHQTNPQIKSELKLEPCSQDYKYDKNIEHPECESINSRTHSDPVIQCTDCPYSCSNKKALKRHVEQVHEGKKKYSCSVCDMKYYRRGVIKNHILTVHKNIDAQIIYLACIFCASGREHESCERSQEEDDHVDISDELKTEANQDYKCQDCDYKSSQKRYILTHSQLNHGSDALPEKVILNCKQCEFETSRSMSLSIHVRAIHNQEVKFACSECVYKTFFKSSINTHIEVNHKDSRARMLVIGCSLCEDKTSHLTCDAQKRNSQTRNSKTKYFRCKICAFSSHISQKVVVDHMKTLHPNDKLFRCDDCAYGANWLPNLNVHRAAMHEGKQFKCNVCGWTTAWKPPFYEHMREKHGVFKRNSKYRKDLEQSDNLCDLCGFSAISVRSMRLHKKSNCELKINITAHRTDQRIRKETSLNFLAFNVKS